MNYIILMASVYLIAIAAVMRTHDWPSALLFKVLSTVLGILLGVHAAKNLGFEF